MGSRKRELIRLRSAFISDVHLGTKDCLAEELLQFLATIEVEYLFLVGDIIDLSAMHRSFHWPQVHSDVLRAILGKARDGVKVIYIPGNHDEVMREFSGSADGREMLVMHGDEFDTAVKCSGWLGRLGNFAYEAAMRCNRGVNACRRAVGWPYWSFASYLKLRLRHAVRYVQAFEQVAARAAAQRNLHGIVCGHIHRAAIREIDGVLYCNDGDWVESGTALIEALNGQLSVWSWAEACRHQVAFEPIEIAA
jgi:UDP-2,3-diacylglucosamine pyrophosphatase LpxH